MKKVLSDRYFLGRRCIFCDKNRLYRLKDNRVKCKSCNKYYSLKKLRTDMIALYYFYLEISAKKAANELEVDYELPSRLQPIEKQVSYEPSSTQQLIESAVK